MTKRSLKLKTLVRAAEIIEERAGMLFEGCKGKLGIGFVCPDCPVGRAVCKREYEEISGVAKKLRSMVQS